MAPSSLSYGDSAPGAGAEDCITSIHRLWWSVLWSSPSRCQTRSRASPAPFLCANSGWLLVGWISCWT